MNRNIIKLYLIIATLLTLGACGKSEQVHTFSGATMGTTYTVKIADDTTITQQQINSRLKQLNKIFSTWDAESELSLLNRMPANHWIPVSDELFYVLKTAKQIYRKTHGYFDPGAGRLIDIWGFGVKKVIQKPSRLMLQNAFRNSSIRHLMFRDRQDKAVIKTKDIHINLSAIAKGYAVDQIAKLLNAQNYLVEIGGEVRAQGVKHNAPWTIAIEHPNNTTPIPITLVNQSIATSGNYRNFFIWKGKRYMHILNPLTGLPADTDLSSVSVLHPSAMLADAYATTLMAIGSRNATALAKILGLKAILILNQAANFRVIEIN
ncbi:MAG: FAD:protein FMN transferase [Gammaproteobacteria bacterium]|uniref:FAD:protein FMN transferase n=1 Tax=endosymbiont of Bathymodiolus septemdierum str. Myojin knoll TaxID=1303921 RepID=A0A0P0UQC7_9GAMM|nr:FAD:protein FMN transferase [Bathymodiolus septemdierum thioautotrophic gill symbiont]RUA04824.1 MAG: FAD:protein FMN transferase [Gammaproteobacteria bacterium]BAS67085.1 thiamine biosynthesis lipoprotein [endosymbiont of Bathymodiolus septemdierum str. Myojin knoll]